MSRRLFTGIRIKPNKEIKNLINFLEKFNSTKTVKEENLHINLKFLGDTPEEKIKDAEKALEELEGFGSFNAKLEETGAFPNQEFIKVIWIGVNTPEIRKLARETEKAYINKEFKERDKVYKPHVTIARVKNKPNPEIKKAFKEEYSKHYKDTEVKEVELIESHLKSSGPTYETIKKVKL